VQPKEYSPPGFPKSTKNHNNSGKPLMHIESINAKIKYYAKIAH